MKKIIALILSLVMISVLGACGNKKAESGKTSEQTQETAAPTQTAETSVDEEAKLYADPISVAIELENGGVMKGELYPNLAPETVKNFVKLAKDKFYDGLIFHRVIDGFMIQGGGYDKDMNPKESTAIKGEFTQNGFNNPLKHTKGVLSMARTNDPDSASSQFFIMQEDAPYLDGQYAAFGRITEGLEYIDEIATAKTGTDPKYGMSDCPVDPIIIKTITVGK